MESVPSSSSLASSVRTAGVLLYSISASTKHPFTTTWQLIKGTDQLKWYKTNEKKDNKKTKAVCKWYTREKKIFSKNCYQLRKSSFESFEIA